MKFICKSLLHSLTNKFYHLRNINSKENFAFTLIKLILISFSAVPTVSLISLISPSPHTEKLFLKLSALLSTQKNIKIQAKLSA